MKTYFVIITFLKLVASSNLVFGGFLFSKLRLVFLLGLA